MSVNYRFFSKTDGGCSKGVFSSLNGSRFVGDDAKNVDANLNEVIKELGGHKIVLLKQVHGNSVLNVTSETKSYQEFDALVTKERGIIIAILTADCAPVLFYDEANGIVGAAHAGWRGAASGVIENTVAAMKNLGATSINAIIGPCIHAQSYSVDDGFKENFPNALDCFSTINGKLYFDLPGFCKKTLQKCGVQKADIIEQDTYAQHDNYFSYRYAQQHTDGICGRNISAICLRRN